MQVIIVNTSVNIRLFPPMLMMVFAIPANTGDLLTRPWTILTYMFLHLDFLHILFNLLWLYWFGLIFVKYLSQRQLLGTYLFGGIA